MLSIKNKVCFYKPVKEIIINSQYNYLLAFIFLLFPLGKSAQIPFSGF